MTNEKWAPVRGYDNYKVSNFGRIRSIRNGNSRLLKTPDPRHHNEGYCRIGLSNNGKRKQHLVHRLVADAFVDNPDCLPHVNHKDGDKTNNRSDNLEWASRSSNMKHAMQLPTTNTTGKTKNGSVIQLDLGGKYICGYPSATAAAKCTRGAWAGLIVKTCEGTRTSHAGFKWMFEKDFWSQKHLDGNTVSFNLSKDRNVSGSAEIDLPF